MYVRVLGIAPGGSGASLAVADSLVSMLNAGVHPIVPEAGSVGASDLMHMAAIGEVALGRGRAEYRGTTMPGGDALRAAGLVPLTVGPKDGLALISANGVAVGRGALVADRATDIAEVADVAFVASLEATRGNPSIVDPAVAIAKGIAGQTAAMDHIRELLRGSDRCVPGGAGSVQAPLSFRVGPQVHGALRESIRAATDATTASSGPAMTTRWCPSPTDDSSATATSTRSCSGSRSTPSDRHSPTSASSATGGWATCGPSYSGSKMP